MKIFFVLVCLVVVYSSKDIQKWNWIRDINLKHSLLSTPIANAWQYSRDLGFGVLTIMRRSIQNKLPIELKSYSNSQLNQHFITEGFPQLTLKHHSILVELENGEFYAIENSGGVRIKKYEPSSTFTATENFIWFWGRHCEDITSRTQESKCQFTNDAVFVRIITVTRAQALIRDLRKESMKKIGRKTLQHFAECTDIDAEIRPFFNDFFMYMFDVTNFLKSDSYDNKMISLTEKFFCEVQRLFLDEVGKLGTCSGFANAAAKWLEEDSFIRRSSESVETNGTIPTEWTCSESYYNSSDGCDCGCGIVDPDCYKDDQELLGCLNEALGQALNCSSEGTCVYELSTNVPPSWTCNSDFYDSGDGCDCNCGVHDPDCDDGSLTTADIFGCDAGTVTSCNAGVCVYESPPIVVDASWTCPDSYYGTGDGCDCGCGAVDPDCSDVNSFGTYNCPCEGMQCSATGECIGVCNGVQFGTPIAGGNADLAIILLSVFLGLCVILNVIFIVIMIIGGSVLAFYVWGSINMAKLDKEMASEPTREMDDVK